LRVITIYLILYNTNYLFRPPNVTLLHPITRFCKIYVKVENRKVKSAEISAVKVLPHTNL